MKVDKFDKNTLNSSNGTYNGKRLFDFLAAVFGLLILSPLLLSLMLLIWLQDRKSPIYKGPRVGHNGKSLNMMKLRSMTVNADKTGVSSTSAGDVRITPIGSFVRKYKLDELLQLWNVMTGDMSLVGPRPQVASDVEHYDVRDQKLLLARPGITDISSIIFSDEGNILADSQNPDLDYSRLIRPWKIKFGLIYVQNCSFFIDMQLCIATIIAIFNKKHALRIVEGILLKVDCDYELIQVAKRTSDLTPQELPDTLAKKFNL